MPLWRKACAANGYNTCYKNVVKKLRKYSEYIVGWYRK
jgi:hypothetical protein